MPTMTLEMQRAGGKARAEQYRTDKAELERLRAYVASLPLPEPAPKPAPEPAVLAEQYLAERLAITREQIAKLNELITSEEDPQKLDRLASALSRLSEIERQLANRPLPGSLKPSSPSRRHQTRIEPLPDEPSSLPNPTPKQVQP